MLMSADPIVKRRPPRLPAPFCKFEYHQAKRAGCKAATYQCQRGAINNRRVVFEGEGGTTNPPWRRGSAFPNLFHYFNVQEDQSAKLKLTTKKISATFRRPKKRFQGNLIPLNVNEGSPPNALGITRGVLASAHSLSSG